MVLLRSACSCRPSTNCQFPVSRRGQFTYLPPCNEYLHPEIRGSVEDVCGWDPLDGVLSDTRGDQDRGTLTGSVAWLPRSSLPTLPQAPCLAPDKWHNGWGPKQPWLIGQHQHAQQTPKMGTRMGSDKVRRQQDSLPLKCGCTCGACIICHKQAAPRAMLIQPELLP